MKVTASYLICNMSNAHIRFLLLLLLFSLNFFFLQMTNYCAHQNGNIFGKERCEEKDEKRRKEREFII